MWWATEQTLLSHYVLTIIKSFFLHYIRRSTHTCASADCFAQCWPMSTATFAWTRLFQERKATGLREGQKSKGVECAVTATWSVFARKTRRFQRQPWDSACESWSKRMAGRGWERFASMNVGMKDRLVFMCACICLYVWESEGVNAKERKSGGVEISTGRWEVDAFHADCAYVLVVAIVLHTEMY